MSEFVLVPGAWLGAWAFDRVVPELEREGHSAVPVTLTGMGERAHLLTAEVGIETAIQDVLQTIRYHELGECVLVGHSFAGKVAAAVADRLPRQIPRVIYLDATRPERISAPQAAFDPVQEFGPLPEGSLGVPLTDETIARIGPDVQGAERERLRRLATPWPVRLARDPITLTGGYESVQEAYVYCRRGGDPVDDFIAGKYGKLEGPHRVLDTGHWPMLTAPVPLARDLIALAR